MEIRKISNHFRNNNFRSVVLLIIAVLFIFAGFSFFVFQNIKNSIKGSIKNQQNALVLSMARDIDEKMNSDLSVITEVSKKITPAIMQNPKEAESFINNRPGTSAVFPNGLFLLSKDGKLIAENKSALGKRELNHSDKEYFANCKMSLLPGIACVVPIDGKRPSLIFTTPIFNNRHEFIGLLAGEISINNEGIFVSAGSTQIGQRGYLYIISYDRVLILHPDSTRILTKVLKGTNRLLDSAMAGYEGTDETVNSLGISYLTSFRQMKMMPWILAANFPIAEVYAPLYKAERQIIISIISTLVLLTIILFSLFIRLKKEVEKRIGTEEHAQIILNTAGEGILGIDASGRGTFMNKAGLAILGFNGENEILDTIICGREAGEINDTIPQENSIIFNVPSTEEYFEMDDGVFLKKNGNKISVAYKYAPIKRDGRPEGAVITFTDITDRILAEEELEKYRNHLEELVKERSLELQTELEARKKTENELNIYKDHLEELIKERTSELSKLSLAVEQSFAIIIITDTEGNIEYVNPSFCRLTGFELSEVIGNNPRILKSGFHSKEFYNEFWSTIKSGNVWRGEFYNKKKSGELFWESSIITPIRNEDGDITHFVAVKEDITKQKQVAEELKNAKEAADIANKAKSEFLANMSHEIRTPMNSIIGFSELLYNSLKDEKQKTQVDTIKRSSKNLLRIINDILDLSKIEAGRLKIELAPANLHSIIKDMYSVFKQKLDEKNLDFIIEVEKDIPHTLLLDEIRLRQVLLNLIGNAVKFTDTGYVKLSAHKVTIDKHKMDLTISVKDTGIGIPEKEQKIIFNAFTQQEGQSSKKYGGTGLGLTITKRLVEMMGGSIIVDSEAGKGSSFEIVFSDITVIEEADVLPAPADFNPDSVRFSTAKILICDDVDENRTLLVDLLGLSPLIFYEASNGKEALEMAAEVIPELILMDLRMPVMDGYEATRQLKRNEKTKHIPIIALSASAVKDLDTNKDIFDDYLMKPLELDNLIVVLMKYLKYKIMTRIEPTAESKSDNMFSNLTEEQLKMVPDIIAELENEFLPEYYTVMKKQMIDQISDWGKKVASFGDKTGFAPIAAYGKELSAHAENIDIANIFSTLKLFPKLIEKIKEINYAKK